MMVRCDALYFARGFINVLSLAIYWMGDGSTEWMLEEWRRADYYRAQVMSYRGDE